MMVLKIELLEFEDLTEEEKMGAPNNGHGKEMARHVRITHEGNLLYFESDAMEPEDATFVRDLSWVPTALEKCYLLGRQDEREDK